MNYPTHCNSRRSRPGHSWRPRRQASKHVLSSDEVKKATPAEYFFRGQKAPVQLRNAVGFQLADGKMMLAALVDASGYSTAIQQKYQGLLITETKLNIGGSELAARPIRIRLLRRRQVCRDGCFQQRRAERAVADRRRPATRGPAETGRGRRRLQAVCRQEVDWHQSRVRRQLVLGLGSCVWRQVRSKTATKTCDRSLTPAPSAPAAETAPARWSFPRACAIRPARRRPHSDKFCWDRKDPPRPRHK